MIYILVGEDLKNKSLYTKELTKNCESFLVKEQVLDRDLIMSYCYNVNLFNKSPSIIIENVLNDEEVQFKKEDLNTLKNSGTIFIFNEDKLLKVNQDKYKKYGEIKLFKNKKVSSKNVFNVFSITDAFSNKNKIEAWTLFNEALKQGVEPENIAGILFWKIKTMILNSTNTKIKNDLKRQSSTLISLYHKSHKGEIDLSIGLEVFILDSLSSKKIAV